MCVFIYTKDTIIINIIVVIRLVQKFIEVFPVDVGIAVAR